MNPRTPLAAIGSGLLVAAMLAACSSGEPLPNGVGAPLVPAQCRTPQAGCVCEPEGLTVDCGEKVSNAAGNLVCMTGTRRCQQGRWGACDTTPGTSTATHRFGNLAPLGLGGPGACAASCDPYCTSYQDTAPGVTPPGFATGDAGVTLSGSAGCSTRVKGVVRDPAGVLPLPNVFVFLREGAMAPLAQGPAADTCATILTGGVAGGLPDVRVTTGVDGSFDLQLPAGYPSGSSVPIVIQAGRWRREISVTANCGTVNVPAADSRLPRNHLEGNIPQFAVITGNSDGTECLLLKMGIDPSEFTHPSGTGRVHMYYSGFNSNFEGPAPKLAPGVPVEGRALVNQDPAAVPSAPLNDHSILVTPCVGSLKSWANPPERAFYPTDQEVLNVRNFVNKGGRLFTTHLSDMWLDHVPDGGGGMQDIYPGAVSWIANMASDSGNLAGTGEGDVLVAPPRAQQFRDWMASGPVLGLNGNGRVNFVEQRKRALSPGAQGTGWLRNYRPLLPDPYYHHITFDTPVSNPVKAGRVVYFGSHVAAEAYRRNGGSTFPANCTGAPLDSGEKALEYMLFDLAACVGAPPPAPAPIFSATAFTRDFQAVCAPGLTPRWRLYNHSATVPSDSRIDFTAQTAPVVADLATAPSFPVRSATALAPNPPAPGVMIDADTGATVIPRRSSRAFLRITANFVPSSDGQSAPSLATWSQTYDCEPSE
ncbi:MAG: hypothetical protein IPQ09_28690 [Myxococcales bacterium]|nr:hypothetical protein [Myxococcales bacterium]